MLFKKELCTKITVTENNNTKFLKESLEEIPTLFKYKRMTSYETRFIIVLLINFSQMTLKFYG